MECIHSELLCPGNGHPPVRVDATTGIRQHFQALVTAAGLGSTDCRDRLRKTAAGMKPGIGGAPALVPVLEVADLHKRFGDTEVLKGINFSTPPGEVIAVIGSSGSGKSTLLR